MNYLKLSKDIKYIIVCYLNRSINDVKNIKQEISTHIKYMNELVNYEKFITEDQFIKIYHETILGDVNHSIMVNDNFLIDMDYEFTNDPEDEDEYNLLFNITVTFVYHNWNVVRICKRNIEFLGLKNFDDKFNKLYLINIIKRIESIFVCKCCLKFTNKGNKLLKICDNCIFYDYPQKYKKCNMCDEINNDYIFTLNCGHDFHLNCIKYVQLYENDDCELYCKCPKCNINCMLLYFENKQFHFESEYISDYGNIEYKKIIHTNEILSNKIKISDNDPNVPNLEDEFDKLFYIKRLINESRHYFT